MVLPPSQEPLRHRTTIGEVRCMIDAGVLDEPERLELLDGSLLRMPPLGPEQAVTTDSLSRRLRRVYEGVAVVRNGNPISRDDTHEPQPDLCVAKGDDWTYARRHPTGTELLLVIEVADSSLRRDRIKLRDYAGCGVPMVWILDVAGRRLESHGQLRDGEYQLVQILGEDMEISPPETTVSWRVGELLPPR